MFRKCFYDRLFVFCDISGRKPRLNDDLLLITFFSIKILTNSKCHAGSDHNLEFLICITVSCIEFRFRFICIIRTDLVLRRCPYKICPALVAVQNILFIYNLKFRIKLVGKRRKTEILVRSKSLQTGKPCINTKDPFFRKCHVPFGNDLLLCPYCLCINQNQTLLSLNFPK